MKWIALTTSLLLVIPLTVWIRRHPRQSLKLWMLLGFLPFIVNYFHLYMAAYSAPEWGGYVKGAEISILDIIALSLYLSLPDTRRSLPFRYLMALLHYGLDLRYTGPGSHSSIVLALAASADVSYLCDVLLAGA